MYLPDFDYFAPDSVEAVCKTLSENEGALVVSGGTDILIKMKNGVMAPKALVSLKNVPDLRKIEYVAGKGVVIGGACTHNDLVFSEVLNEKFNSVSEAAHTMAANQVRHAGTVGGNIATAIPSADLPPILIALNATVTLVSPNGTRSLLVEEVFTGVSKTCIAANEVITEVIIPDQAMTGSAYFKYALRKAGALAVVGVAVAVQVEGDTIKDARVAFGAVAPTPMRAVKVEEFLKGKKISEETFEEAAKIAHDECKPISDHRASEEYRRAMVGVFTKRGLKKAIENGHQ